MSSPDPDQTTEITITFRAGEIIAFVVGFLGWYLANGLVWLIYPGPLTGSQGYPGLFALLTLPANAVVLLVCAIIPRLRKVALGILTALALNFFAALMAGMMFNALCFVPFFRK